MFIKRKKIAIVGSGLVGSLLSIYLSKKGYIVEIFESRDDMRKESFSAGRSINLALSDRGRKALREVGIENKIMSISVPVHKRLMHSISGDLTEQYYGKKNQAIYSVPRKELNCMLMDLAEENGVKINFSNKCIDIDFENTELKFKNSERKKFDFVFGADGAGSIVRKKMNLFSDLNVYTNIIDCGYKELTIPPSNKGAWIIDSDALHIWPRESYMVMALPNQDGSFTITLFFPLKGKNSFENLKTNSDVNDFFSTKFPDLFPLIPNLSDQYFKNPVSSLGIIRCDSWKVNNFMLIGDSCHATVPFYGQGMNAGFEDCNLINEIINDSSKSSLFKTPVNEFLNRRKLNTTAMQDLSMHNFIVMRDKTGDQKFLLQKKIEALFAEKNPTKWTPLYSMVTFSHIDYNDALIIGKKQEKIMREIMEIENIDLIWDSQKIQDKILSLL